MHLRREGGLSELATLEVRDKSKLMLGVRKPFNIETNYVIFCKLLLYHTFLWKKYEDTDSDTTPNR